MKHNKTFAGLAVVLSAGAVFTGYMIGATHNRPAKAELSATPADAPGSVEDSADVVFARGMAVHHAQAVDMAERIRIRTTDPKLRILGTDIVLSQQSQIGRFQGWLEAWNVPLVAAPSSSPVPGLDHNLHGTEVMPGMATRTEVSALSTVEVSDAERQFLDLMIKHHKGGVAMAKVAGSNATRPEVRRLANAIVASQSNEINAMKLLLEQRRKA